MQKALCLDHPPVDEETLFRQLRIPPDAEPEDRERLREMLRGAAAVAYPKAVYALCPVGHKAPGQVEIGGRIIRSELVSRNLANANRVVAYVATCGVELEAWSQQYAGDLLEEYWADGIKLLYLGRIRQALTEEVRRAYFPTGDLSVMSPGSLSQWPLTEQCVLFSLLDGVTQATGVQLTGTCLMLPSKSVSGFFFSAETHYENCRLCLMPDCPGRRAPYQPGEADTAR